MNKSSPLKKVIIIISAAILLSLSVFLVYQKSWLTKFGRGKAALAVNSLGAPLTVSLEGEILGKTPYYSDELPGGEKDLLLTDGTSSFRTKINLLGGALTVINWNLGPSEVFSEGEVVWLEKARSGSPLLVISTPEGAEVKVDGVLLGITPFSHTATPPGDHTLNLSKEGYKNRQVRIHLEEGYKLNLKAQLLLEPLASLAAPEIEFPEEARITVFDLSNPDPVLHSDLTAWAKGISFYLGGGREATESAYPYDYFLGFDGQLYDSQGAKIAAGSEGEGKMETAKVGYLGKAKGEGLSKEAKSALLEFAPKALTSIAKIKILPTGTGWLRVRETPSLSGKELTKVDEGKEFPLLGEETGWYKIKLPDGGEGWISSQYAEKL